MRMRMRMTMVMAMSMAGSGTGQRVQEQQHVICQWGVANGDKEEENEATERQTETTDIFIANHFKCCK